MLNRCIYLALDSNHLHFLLHLLPFLFATVDSDFLLVPGSVPAGERPGKGGKYSYTHLFISTFAYTHLHTLQCGRVACCECLTFGIHYCSAASIHPWGLIHVVLSVIQVIMMQLELNMDKSIEFIDSKIYIDIHV